jgi:hypothetical protein
LVLAAKEYQWGEINVLRLARYSLLAADVGEEADGPPRGSDSRINSVSRQNWRPSELPVRAGIPANSAESVRNNLVRSPFIGVIGGTLRCFIAYSQLQPFQPVDLEGISRLEQAGLRAGPPHDGLADSLVSGPSLASARGKGMAGQLSQVGGERQTSSGLQRQTLVGWQVAASLIQLAVKRMLLSGFWTFRNTPIGKIGGIMRVAQIEKSGYQYSNSGLPVACFGEPQLSLGQK